MTNEEFFLHQLSLEHMVNALLVKEARNSLDRLPEGSRTELELLLDAVNQSNDRIAQQIVYRFNHIGDLSKRGRVDIDHYAHLDF